MIYRDILDISLSKLIYHKISNYCNISIYHAIFQNISWIYRIYLPKIISCDIYLKIFPIVTKLDISWYIILTKKIHIWYIVIYLDISHVYIAGFLYNTKLCIVQEQNCLFINVDYLKCFVHKVEIRLASKLFIVEIIILIFGTKCPRYFRFLKWMRKLLISRYWRVSRICRFSISFICGFQSLHLCKTLHADYADRKFAPW